MIFAPTEPQLHQHPHPTSFWKQTNNPIYSCLPITKNSQKRLGKSSNLKTSPYRKQVTSPSIFSGCILNFFKWWSHRQNYNNNPSISPSSLSGQQTHTLSTKETPLKLTVDCKENQLVHDGDPGRLVFVPKFDCYRSSRWLCGEGALLDRRRFTCSAVLRWFEAGFWRYALSILFNSGAGS